MTHRNAYVCSVLAAGALIVGPSVNAQTQSQNPERETPEVAKNASMPVAQDLRDAIEDRFATDPLVSLDDVRVTVDGNSITLAGSVPSLLARARAGTIAETVKGVHEVRNLLTVNAIPARTSDEIERMVQSALMRDPAADSYQIVVTATPQGKVTLTGAADSPAEKMLAAQIAESVSGVTSVDNRIELSPGVTRTDSEMLADIRAALQWDAYIDARGVNTDVKNGVATLSGSVNSVAEKKRARSLAYRSGVKEVKVDDLKVDAEAVEALVTIERLPRSDEAVATAAHRAIDADPRVHAENLLVTVDQGVATLRGNVASLGAKRDASSAARSVRGIQFVKNRMRVDPDTPDPADRQIEQSVAAALAANPVVEQDKIAVEVERGVVELEGHVTSWFARAVADDLAADVRGVRRVDNELLVTNVADRLTFDPYLEDWPAYEFAWYNPAPTTAWRPDSVVATSIRDQLWWSPFVSQEDVTVSVDNGVATLSGDVDSYAQRRAATENAFDGGAVGVINRLTVSR